MSFAALAPLTWAVAGVVAVVLLNWHLQNRTLRRRARIRRLAPSPSRATTQHVTVP